MKNVNDLMLETYKSMKMAIEDECGQEYKSLKSKKFLPDDTRYSGYVEPFITAYDEFLQYAEINSKDPVRYFKDYGDEVYSLVSQVLLITYFYDRLTEYVERTNDEDLGQYIT